MIRKKIVFTIMLLMCIIMTGCSAEKKDKENNEEIKESIKEENKEAVKEEQKMLLCKNSPNIVVFDFDENKNVIGMYYESIFDMRDYYTESELKDFKIHETYKKMLPKIISEKIIDCNNASYSCNSSYNNYIITNKVYVDNYKEAQLLDLDEFYGVNRDSLKQNMYYKGITCEEIDKDDKYVIKKNEIKININGNIYNSIEDMKYEINKPEYYKKYTLAEFDGKKATIEFKDNGKCEINLKEFNFEYWNRIYCDKEKHKNMMKIAYLDGNCSYTISSKYSFTITYDGKYEFGQYCESYDDKSRMQTKDVVQYPNNIIEIKFDDTYDSFTFLNGSWIKNKTSGIVEYKY